MASGKKDILLGMIRNGLPMTLGQQIRLTILLSLPAIAAQFSSVLMQYIDADTLVSDWTKSHANFFRAVQIEKNVMFIILLLIVAVAAFNSCPPW